MSHHGALTPKPRSGPRSGGACAARGGAGQASLGRGGAARSAPCRRRGSRGRSRRNAQASGVPSTSTKSPRNSSAERDREHGRQHEAARVVRMVVVDAVDHPVQPRAETAVRARSGRRSDVPSTRRASRTRSRQPRRPTARRTLRLRTPRKPEDGHGGEEDEHRRGGVRAGQPVERRRREDRRRGGQQFDAGTPRVGLDGHRETS